MSKWSHNTIPASKVPAFLLMMEKIAEEKGSYSKACIFSGINHGQFSIVKNGIKPLSPFMAEKILKAYKSLKAKNERP